MKNAPSIDKGLILSTILNASSRIIYILLISQLTLMSDSRSTSLILSLSYSSLFAGLFSFVVLSFAISTPESETKKVSKAIGLQFIAISVLSILLLFTSFIFKDSQQHYLIDAILIGSILSMPEMLAGIATLKKSIYRSAIQYSLPGLYFLALYICIRLNSISLIRISSAILLSLNIIVYIMIREKSKISSYCSAILIRMRSKQLVAGSIESLMIPVSLTILNHFYPNKSIGEPALFMSFLGGLIFCITNYLGYNARQFNEIVNKRLKIAPRIYVASSIWLTIFGILLVASYPMGLLFNLLKLKPVFSHLFRPDWAIAGPIIGTSIIYNLWFTSFNFQVEGSSKLLIKLHSCILILIWMLIILSGNFYFSLGTALLIRSVFQAKFIATNPSTLKSVS